MEFNPKNAELHLGILQNRKRELEGKLRACALKLDQEGADQKAIDKDFKKFDKQLEAVEKQLTVYEDEVLTLTKL